LAAATSTLDDLPVINLCHGSVIGGRATADFAK
jgi:hypothetical protein